MMNFRSTEVHESDAVEGVRFTVRVLNVIQRARRDAEIADQRLEFTRLLEEYRALGDEERNSPAGRRLDYLSGLIADQYLKPASIRAGLVSIEGLSVDGEPVTDADGLIERGPDALIEEVWLACEAASGLSEEQRKNSSSPGTSAGREDGGSGNLNAPNADGAGSTGSETAGGTSPAT